MTRQVGNELDEFVTEALRNRLLGLPLDLATLNIVTRSRHRDPGAQRGPSGVLCRERQPGPGAVHQLGGLRLQPEERRLAGELHRRLRHAHVDHTAAAGPDGQASRGADSADIAAAGNQAEGQDAYDFINSTGSHTRRRRAASPRPVSTRIDLWMGGLAEKQMVFGGLLGPTFNYVFENQMENLQDGDRFYYLSRTAGLNMLTQLEGNSFAELIMRNTDVEALPADSFSRPAFIFDLRAQNATGPIVDDPATAGQRDARAGPSCLTARSATTDPSTSCSTAGTPAGRPDPVQ